MVNIYHILNTKKASKLQFTIYLNLHPNAKGLPLATFANKQPTNNKKTTKSIELVLSFIFSKSNRDKQSCPYILHIYSQLISQQKKKFSYRTSTQILQKNLPQQSHLLLQGPQEFFLQ